MSTPFVYKLLLFLLFFSIAMVGYGILAHFMGLSHVEASLSYGALLFQAVVLLIVLYKIAVNVRAKKPIGNLLGVFAALATAFIGATYLYIAIMEAVGK
ncbi:hypothetical protein [Maribacter sp. 2307ULW6-5]|uniref:hypothetical protein n=1 Tax=Maribacter sp. 2307ULW6-5 TaxID=3386275 RepID=UPI0039BCF6AF